MANDISLLDRVTIPEPCPASWETMRGNSRKRFCDQCGKHVHNLSALTRDEAERVLMEHGDDLCGRIKRRGDGRIVTRWEPKAPERWPRWARAVAAVAMWAFTLVSGGCWQGVAGGMRTGGSVRVDGATPASAPDSSAAQSVDPEVSNDRESNPAALGDVTKP